MATPVLQDQESSAQSIIPSPPEPLHSTDSIDLAHYNPQNAPIHRLPIETLGEVFIAAVDRAPLYPVIGPESAQLKILLVCKRWHQVCLSTPRFWSFFAFKSQDHIKLLEPWLKRTRNAPLRFIFDWLNTSEPLPHELIQTMPRWELACLDCCISPELLSDLACKATRLKSLSLGEWLGNYGALFLLETMPHLHTLKLKKFRLAFKEATTLNLTYLRLYDGAFHVNFVCILQHLPHLAFFSLRNSSTSKPNIPDTPRYKHGALKTLHLEGLSLDQLPQFLEPVELPALEELELHYNMERLQMPPHAFHTILVDFVTRTMSLGRLSLHRCLLTMTQVVELLRACPQLRELAIHDIDDFSHQGLAQLILDPSDLSHGVVPDLTSMKFTLRGLCKVLLQNTINKILLSRWRRNIKTEILMEVYGLDPVPMDDPAVFEMLKRGAHLRFNNWSSKKCLKEGEMMKHWRHLEVDGQPLVM